MSYKTEKLIDLEKVADINNTIMKMNWEDRHYRWREVLKMSLNYKDNYKRIHKEIVEIFCDDIPLKATKWLSEVTEESSIMLANALREEPFIRFPRLRVLFINLYSKD